VRAERIRWLRPWLIAIIVIFILVGLFLLLKVRPARSSENNSALMSEVARDQAPATAAVSGLPPLTEAVATAASSNPASELPQIIGAILPELDRSDSLPATIGHAGLTPTEFWRNPWPQGKLATTGTHDVVLVGGAFNAAPANTSFYRYQPSPQRWIGVFRKKGAAWEYATLSGPSFIIVPGQPAVQVELIPLTLKPVLPEGN
jgi:hypothetical protein